ncbi:MAG: ATP-binding protein [Acidimicrobiales bacterium]
MRLIAHRATTAQLGAAYPFMSEGGLGGRGSYIGRDVFGGAFTYDPFELYAAGILTNPNMVVIGQIGRGKSALMKTWLWRQAAFGRRAWVVDPKGEYQSLAQAFGVRTVRIAPGAGVRLNPLEGGTPPAGSADDREPARRRLELLGSLAEATLGRRLAPRERAAIELALERVTREAAGRAAGGPAPQGGPEAGDRAAGARQVGGPDPVLPDVVQALLVPTEESARTIHTDAATLSQDGREVALELRRLVDGDLAGMFDGPTTPGIDLDAPLVVLDLSALYTSAALGILMTCATAWLQATLSRRDGHRRIVVIDEAWAILANLGIARWLQSSWKLARALGVANVAVLHRLSDLRAVGGVGSEQAALAEGLLSDSETRVVYGQPPGEVATARELLGLTGTEAALLAQLPRGVALWKLGRRSFLVEHRLATCEVALTHTDGAMVS